MSASRSSYSRQERLFQFSMEFPVPSYLVALVAGDLQHVDVGPRSVPVDTCGRGRPRATIAQPLGGALARCGTVRGTGSDVTHALSLLGLTCPGAACGRSRVCCPAR